MITDLILLWLSQLYLNGRLRLIIYFSKSWHSLCGSSIIFRIVLFELFLVKKYRGLVLEVTLLYASQLTVF